MDPILVPYPDADAYRKTVDQTVNAQRPGTAYVPPFPVPPEKQYRFPGRTGEGGMYRFAVSPAEDEENVNNLLL